ncbi:phage tail protein [Polaribacter vadi]|uniref:phage tail protein n=1 Tax=Polaribacter TaxID=52959 RepID=UPI001C09F7AB|nr:MULTISPECIES: tail fiber protein [Polaribacter]MBU3011266.1 phage tail protein [Polaribacter vadi]MDO6741079.1 phage tail protein [Polaribacter sp. 1_MG-2023]
MKQISILVVALLFSATIFAQGIAVQGVARDNAKGAIVNQTLNFTFEIIDEEDLSIYSETENIQTDSFGVFSHILGPGNRLQNVDFSLPNLKIKVSINFNGNLIIVYNEGFLYTPYAHYAKKATEAENGVPTGSIMPFMGEEAPEGWLLCDGNNIPTGSEFEALKTLLDDTKTPNLQGRFLKGAGYNSRENALDRFNFDETTIGEYQSQAIEKHYHDKGTLANSTDGNHTHSAGVWKYNSGGGERDVVGLNREPNNASPSYYSITSSDGNHTHAISGRTGDTPQGTTINVSTEETMPNNFSVNYIIKL